MDLWSYLSSVPKPIVMYGMGDGADKILKIFERYNLVVADFFASDEFVRGHFFHGKKVLKFSEICDKYREFVIVLAFASGRPEVLEYFSYLNAHYDLIIPDVPVVKSELFTREYYIAHEEEIAKAKNLFADKRSIETFEKLIEFRLTGRFSTLKESFSERSEIFHSLLHPEKYSTVVDLGAYTGDTIKEIFHYSKTLSNVYAVEPDLKTYLKLSRIVEQFPCCKFHFYQACAWNEITEKAFDLKGNRGSHIQEINSLSAKNIISTISVDHILKGGRADYIKFDIEGAESAAIDGSRFTITNYAPDLLVSAYHRSEDLFSLVLQLHTIMPQYRFYLRKEKSVPAWDINLIATVH